MRIGRLRHRVDIQKMESTASDIGAATLKWSTVPIVSGVWAGIEPLRSREFLELQQLQSEVSHRIVLRYSSNYKLIPARNRIKFGTRYFDITSVINPDERNISYELLTRETVTT